MIASEWLKWKSSSYLYLFLGWAGLKLASIPLYLSFVTNPLILEGVIELSMLGDCLVLTLLTLLMAEQERQANHFQQILGERHSVNIWFWKLIVLDAFLTCSCFLLWGGVGLVRNELPQFLQVALAVLSLEIWISHVHLFLALLVPRTVNLMIAFLDCLVVVFASNHAFEGWYGLATALPINALLGDTRALYWGFAWSGLTLLLQLGYVGVER